MDFAIFVKIETIHGMKRSGCIRMAAVILLIFSGISLSAQNVIYVSPDGRDSADGSESRPMASIEAAQIRARGIEGPCTIMLRGGHQNNRQYGIHRDNRMVENIFEELDAPGEWSHDSEACRLYYYPVAGEDVHICRFEVPALKHLVEIRGSADNPAMVQRQ